MYCMHSPALIRKGATDGLGQVIFCTRSARMWKQLRTMGEVDISLGQNGGACWSSFKLISFAQVFVLTKDYEEVVDRTVVEFRCRVGCTQTLDLVDRSHCDHYSPHRPQIHAYPACHPARSLIFVLSAQTASQHSKWMENHYTNTHAPTRPSHGPSPHDAPTSPSSNSNHSHRLPSSPETVDTRSSPPRNN